MLLNKEEEELAISKLIELIRFPTVSAAAPLDGSYDACANWLEKELLAIGLEAFILPESLPHKPIVVGTWKGSNPELSAIVLNSHYDVVPVLAEYWTVPAFEGFRQEDRVYGRGTQDMKSVCAQYLVAIQHLKDRGFQPSRTIYLTYVPDEEIGGLDGMNILLKSQWFTSIKIALALDEGLANTGGGYSVFYGERLPWWIHFTATGNTGHGSRFIEGSAIQQVIDVCNKALVFRQEQQDLLHGKGETAGCSHCIARKKARTLGDVTSLNITMLRAGVSAGGKDIINVLPPTAEAGMDIRISPHMDPAHVRNMLDGWCQEVNKSTTGLTENQGLKWELFHEALDRHAITKTDDSNPWYSLFASVLKSTMDVDLEPEVFPAATDSRFLRAFGVNALGFSPIRRSPVLLHEHNEYIEEKVYLEGCTVYIHLIQALASQGDLP
eukprot:gene7435-8222_t